ncbi:hypothetical protein [Azospirillum formosense]|nr:hypothetical protein [Azospirillum formosense]
MACCGWAAATGKSHDKRKNAAKIGFRKRTNNVIAAISFPPWED